MTEESWEFKPETLEEEAARLAENLPLRCAHCGEKETLDGDGWLHVAVSPVGSFTWGGPEGGDAFLDGPLWFCSLRHVADFFEDQATMQWRPEK